MNAQFRRLTHEFPPITLCPWSRSSQSFLGRKILLKLCVCVTSECNNCDKLPSPPVTGWREGKGKGKGREMKWGKIWRCVTSEQAIIYWMYNILLLYRLLLIIMSRVLWVGSLKHTQAYTRCTTEPSRVCVPVNVLRRTWMSKTRK